MGRKMIGRLRQWGPVRTIGALVTLVGVTTVFVVLILPTGASAGSGCDKFRLKSFSPTNATRGDDGNSLVTIAGNRLYRVDDIVIGTPGQEGSYVTVSSWDFVGTYKAIEFTVSDSTDPLPTTGKVGLVSDTSDCIGWSKQTLHVNGE